MNRERIGGRFGWVREMAYAAAMAAVLAGLWGYAWSRAAEAAVPVPADPRVTAAVAGLFANAAEGAGGAVVPAEPCDGPSRRGHL